MKNKIWKIRSNWDGICIEEIFNTCEVVFIGKNGNNDSAIKRFKNDVQKGDLFFVYDNNELKSIAIANSELKSLSDIIEDNIRPNQEPIGELMDVLANNPDGIGVEVTIRRVTTNYGKFGEMTKDIVDMFTQFYGQNTSEE